MKRYEMESKKDQLESTLSPEHHNLESDNSPEKRVNYSFLLACMAGLTGTVVAATGYYLATASTLKLGFFATAAVATAAINPIFPVAALGSLMLLGCVCLLPFLIGGCFSCNTYSSNGSYIPVRSNSGWNSSFYTPNSHYHGHHNDGIIVSNSYPNGNYHDHSHGGQHYPSDNYHQHQSSHVHNHR